MVNIIVGEKGKGKTKVLLEKANGVLKDYTGKIVYIDKSNKHMYELNNSIRLVNIKDYMVENTGEFLGFICGILSQDSDIQAIFLDSFLKVAYLEENEITPVLNKLIAISKSFNVDFVISISMKSANLPAEFKDNVLVAL